VTLAGIAYMGPSAAAIQYRDRASRCDPNARKTLLGDGPRSGAYAGHGGYGMTARKKPEELRSHRWFGASDMRAFGHHSRVAQMVTLARLSRQAHHRDYQYLE